VRQEEMDGWWWWWRVKAGAYKDGYRTEAESDRLLSPSMAPARPASSLLIIPTHFFSTVDEDPSSLLALSLDQ
jgi:hypothetical protein